MSTRSILVLKKGNECRYCFIHWDGANHGDTLKGMPKDKLEAIYEKLGDTNHAYGFSTFHNPEGVEEQIKQYTESLKENPKSSVYKDALDEYRNYTYLPTMFLDMNGKPAAASRQTSGAFKMDKWPKTAGKLPFMCGDSFIFIEFVWTYDMDTGKIGYYTSWKNIPKLKKSPEYSRHIFNGEAFY